MPPLIANTLAAIAGSTFGSLLGGAVMRDGHAALTAMVLDWIVVLCGAAALAWWGSWRVRVGVVRRGIMRQQEAESCDQSHDPIRSNRLRAMRGDR